jgi:hypothetical protein
MRTLGVVIIKGAKTIVERNEKLYVHYFEKPSSIAFNDFFVFVFGNYVCLLMKLKSHEFGIISLC